ncbi:hypothetical protein [Noviherbaspirillum cavernae]|uniref:hypothetical protein n=1 Tax=Noviherbaspirillum cavernae TaxID=2320862 RepID=UPI0011C46D9F|nr:hypothetical protein [Noviherbaspirillum cavernae]
MLHEMHVKKQWHDAQGMTARAELVCNCELFSKWYRFHSVPNLNAEQPEMNRKIVTLAKARPFLIST